MKNSAKLLGIIVLAAVIGFSTIACGDGGGDVETVAVYVSGRYVDSNGDSKACYWKDGTRTDLSLPSGAQTTYGGIAVVAQ